MLKETILSVEDDKNLQGTLKAYLDKQGYEVLAATNAEEALEKINTTPSIKAVLLDLGLPDDDGLNLIKDIQEKLDACIIIVSGKDAIADRIVGLEMGADDYVVKPFELRELYARIKAVIRRREKEKARRKKEKPVYAFKDGTKYKFGSWVFDTSRYDLFRETGEAVGLTTGEFRLLEVLIHASQRTLTRDQLFDATRGMHYDSYDRAVDIYIARLRKKLNDNPKSPKFIKTIRGVGYMFCPKVEHLDR